MELKNLYVAKSFDELGKAYAMPKLKNRQINKLVSSSDTLYTEAEKNLRDGDEEMAYINFVKYFQLVQHILGMVEHQSEKEYYQKLIGKIKIRMSIEKSELLSVSLKKRYRAAAGYGVQAEQSNDNGEKQSQVQPKISKTNANVTNKELITVKDLYGMLQMQQVGVLVMDCRSESDFNGSRLNYPCCLNVPEEIIRNGMSAGKIQSELSKEAKVLWGLRSLKDYVVLMDWNSSAQNQNTPIKTLKNILCSWDQDVTYRNPIMTLIDGYEHFMFVYPMMTTNPAYVPQKSMATVDSVNDIEYPDINFIQMKDNQKFGTEAFSPPTIDRSSKFAAEKKYTTNADIINERDRVAEQALKNHKEALEAEYALKEIALKEEKTISDSKIAEQTQLEKQALNNKIMQMKDRETEFMDTIKQLELKLSLTMATEPNRPDQSLMKRDAERKLEEQRIIKERKKLEEENRILADRAQKRITDQSIPKRILPSQPSYDRSVKPSSAVISDEIEREFHPEPGATKLKKTVQFSTNISTISSRQLDTYSVARKSIKPYECIRKVVSLANEMGPGLCGLKNLGNTCYMNSIMQCLSNTVLLKDYFISDDGYKRDRVRNGKIQRHIADEVSAVMREIWLNHHRHISSYDLRRIVGQFQQIFRGMDQQDSHEFLTILMDWLHSDLQRDDLTIAPKAKLSASDKAWQDFVKSKESYIMNLFYGQIKSTVKCTVCKGESATYDGFSNLSLELPANSNKCDIKDCMDMYFFGERISGWNCAHCKQPRDAIKKLDISKLPPILVIHFKRFNVDLESTTSTYKKKQNSVKFPLSGLDVTSYIAPTERNSDRVRNTVYNLYGVSNHYGTMERGHYTAFCKNSLHGKWYKYDDHIVTPMDSSDVVSSAGYILFYTTLE